LFKSQSNLNINDINNVELLGNLLLSDILKSEKESLIVKGKYEELSRKSFF
jgi:hypothetical protein